MDHVNYVFVLELLFSLKCILGSKMAATGCKEMMDIHTSLSCLSLKDSFSKMLENVANKLDMNSLKVIKTKLKIKHSYLGGEPTVNAMEVLMCLCGSYLINEQDLDLLEDLLSPNEDALKIVRNFKTKRPVKICFLPSGSTTTCCSGMLSMIIYSCMVATYHYI